MKRDLRIILISVRKQEQKALFVKNIDYFVTSTSSVTLAKCKREPPELCLGRHSQGCN